MSDVDWLFFLFYHFTNFYKNILTNKNYLCERLLYYQNLMMRIGGSKGEACTPPGIQILSISCSFWEILAKSCVDAPCRVRAPTSGKFWIRHWCSHCCEFSKGISIHERIADRISKFFGLSLGEIAYFWWGRGVLYFSQGGASICNPDRCTPQMHLLDAPHWMHPYWMHPPWMNPWMGAPSLHWCTSPIRQTVNRRAIRVLLEYILVSQ